MKSPDGKVSEPPPQRKKNDNYEEDEKSVQKTTNTLINLNLNPELSQNNTPTQQKIAKSKDRNTTPATLKYPVTGAAGIREFCTSFKLLISLSNSI